MRLERTRWMRLEACYCSTVSAISFFLAHSGQMMSSPSVMNPFPTMLDLQDEQMKQSLCQWRPSNEMNLVPPIPVMGLLQAVHRFEKSSPKQSAQYGLSSLEVNRCPARDFWQWVQVKHSRCQGSLRYVTPPCVITLLHLMHFVANFSSYHLRVLYSIFFIPALKTSPHPSHRVANWAS